jgi:hypothetical protein
MWNRRATAATTLAFGFVAFPHALAAQQSPPKVPHRVPKVQSEARVDGVLDDEVWQQALVLELAYEVRPGENIAPPVRTEVLLAYSDSRFYAAFRAFDPNPGAVRANITDRDAMYGDDWVALILDTFNDERRTFDFLCNPLGVQGDMIESPEGGEGDWDAIWDSDGQITPDGYVVEIAIPFSSLRFQASEGDQIWGFDAVRSYPRGVRHHIGLFPRDRSNNCYMCQSEKLVGFAGASPGRNVELDPTMYGVLTQERDAFPTGGFSTRDKTFEPGVTARWGVTPSLTLNATANPDFSNVEADVAQLDINLQFALFYPEKRPFFLEGASFYNTRLNAVHTRTLADPIWGTKLTGKEGGNAIGFFTAHDDITNLLFPASQGSRTMSLSQRSLGTVLRYRRDLGRASNIGLIVTDREGAGYHNRLAGIDGAWKMTNTDEVRVQVLGSHTRYPDSVGVDFGQPAGGFASTALDVFYLHATRGHDWYGVYRQVGRDFRADLGYMPRADFRYGEVGWGHTWFNSPDHWWNMLNFGAGASQMWDLEGTRLQRGLEFWFNYAGLGQTYLDVGGQYGTETYNGIEFDSRYLELDFSVQGSGRLEFAVEAAVGERIDYANTRQGHGIRLEPYVGLKIGRHLAFNLGHSFERLSVDGGRLYTANISQLRTVYCFTKRVFLRAILQYVHYNRNAPLYTFAVDPLSKSLFSQVLFSYKINPQTVLFLGYSDNHAGDQDIGLTQSDRTVFMKLGYAWVL